MHKKERYCTSCVWSEYVFGKSPLSCGFICRINPFRPVIMGVLGKCSERKQNKKEQYSKEKSKK